MKTIVQTLDGKRGTIPVGELVSFWFAISSPLTGVLMGLLGAERGLLPGSVRDKSQEVTDLPVISGRSDHTSVNPSELAIRRA